MKEIKSLLSILLIVVLLLLTVGCGLSEDTSSYMKSKNSNDNFEDTYGYSEDYIDPDIVTSNEEVINILLIGQDRRSTGAARLRSDCCMIVSLNQETKEVSLISLMRDQYVKDPRYDPENPSDDIEEYFPINYSYLLGEKDDIFGLIDDTIELNYGVKIDYHMEVDFFRFVDVFDKICPINVELTQEEADYLNSETKWIAQAGIDNTDWNLVAGVNAMNAGQLLSYCRTRYIANGNEVQDFGRTSRQRNVVQTVFDTLRTKSLDEMFELINEVYGSITTDMSVAQMGAIIYKLWNDDYYQQFNSYRIPVDGTYQQQIIRSNVYGVGTDLHLITIDAEANAEYLQEYIYGIEEDSEVEVSEYSS